MLVLYCVAVLAQDMRPVRDDIGYCWKPLYFEPFMDYLRAADTGEKELPLLVAGISPHDDYLYAGHVYYRLYKHIQAREVVVFGVTHSAIREMLQNPVDKLVFDYYSTWPGPYKPVKISSLRDYLKENLDPDRVIISNDAHAMEHSVEGMIPFLQYENRDVELTPILVTAMDFPSMEKIADELSTILSAYIKEKNLTLGKDIFFLISADANHYGKDFDNVPFGEDEAAHETGTSLDKKIASMYLEGRMTVEKVKGLTGTLCGSDFRKTGDTLWCGRYSIGLGMMTVIRLTEKLNKNKQLTGRVLAYSDTYSDGVIPLKKPGFGITAPFSLKHWVGYLAAGFYWQER